MTNFFGHNFPFFSPTFVLPRQENVRLIKNDLKQLLLTGLEERVMRPSFGTNIRKSVFEPLDSRLIEQLRDEIFFAIRTFEPRVVTREVNFSASPDQSQMTITVIAALTRDPNVVLSVDAVFNTGPNATIPTQQAGV
jgi:phage baseplate assembly protein W